MPTIISPPKPNKQVDCRNCNATLGYSRSEVQEHRYTDWDGSRDVDYYIVCPCCAAKVYVKA